MENQTEFASDFLQITVSLVKGAGEEEVVNVRSITL